MFERGEEHELEPNQRWPLVPSRGVCVTLFTQKGIDTSFFYVCLI